MGHYEIRKSSKDTSQPWYFVLVASNGEIIATIEMYSQKHSAAEGIKSVRANAPCLDVRDKT